MNVEFVKYHGTGNDFILIDDREQKMNMTRDQIAFLCHRRFGIGADGLLLLGNSVVNDFSMKYFNADGAEGTMCGNGGRCITAFARSLGIIHESARFSAIDGEHFAKFEAGDSQMTYVSLKMTDVKTVDYFNSDFVIDTGSPHLVKIVSDMDKVDVYTEGKRLRWDKAFQPGGINVNFAEIKSDHLVVRSFERGVEDITLSCGTGVTAAAIAASILSEDNLCRFDILTEGGKLVVRFTGSENTFTDIWLEGPAIKVFEGRG
ncbi:MAG: diaminopimelate epimerase, partial [Bacteroidetes bacterium]|nr:diaminopimelate epimerase [Bacteroidota bacterium]